ncbi:MAG: hypothetical protein ACRDOX_00050 [Nocardioides sp.]
MGMSIEGQPFDLNGVNPWDYEWMSTGETIVVAHPTYPQQRHPAYVATITTAAGVIQFAAGEMSANAWAFYLPDTLNHFAGRTTRPEA